MDMINPFLQSIQIADALVSAGIKGDLFRLAHPVICSSGLFGNDRRFDAQLIGNPLGQGAKFHIPKKAKQNLWIRIAHFQIINRKGKRRCTIKLYKLFREPDLIGIGDQAFAALGLFDFTGPVEQAIKIAIFIDQKGGSFYPDARRAGDIVDAIARQSLYIHNTFRKDTEFFIDPVTVNTAVFHCIIHFNAAAHQLHQVFVRADDGDPAACIARLHRKRGDDVICLIAFHFFAGDIKRAGGIAGQRHLRAQILRHFIAVGFVLIIKIVAKRVTALVKNNRDMGGRVRPGIGFHIALQHIAKATDSPDRKPVRFAGQRRQCVISAKDKCRAVDQVQVVTFAKIHFAVSLIKLLHLNFYISLKRLAIAFVQQAGAKSLV